MTAATCRICGRPVVAGAAEATCHEPGSLACYRVGYERAEAARLVATVRLGRALDSLRNLDHWMNEILRQEPAACTGACGFAELDVREHALAHRGFVAGVVEGQMPLRALAADPDGAAALADWTELRARAGARPPPVSSVEGIPPPSRPGAYSTHEAARIIGVTPMTVIRWIEDGKVRATKTPGGHRRILVADLEQLVREHGMPRRRTPGDGAAS